MTLQGFRRKRGNCCPSHEKLASSNAELQASKTALEKKVTALTASLGYYSALKHSYASDTEVDVHFCLFNQCRTAFTTQYLVCFSTTFVCARTFVHTYLHAYVCMWEVHVELTVGWLACQVPSYVVSAGLAAMLVTCL